MNRRKGTSIKYESIEAVKSGLLELFIYLIFLVATTIVANASHNVYMFYFNQTLEKLFITRETQTKFGLDLTFNELATTTDWWSFLEDNFLNDIHGFEDKKKRKIRSQNSSSSGGLKQTVLMDNVLLGPPRLRQIRVKPNSCKPHQSFARYFNSCYSGYTRAHEDTSEQFKGTSFYTLAQLNVLPIRGVVKHYYGAGYVKSLSYDRKQNDEILKKLKTSEWIDRGTRIIILEFVLFNTNSLIFDNIKILAELPPVGGVITSHQFHALKLHSLWSELDYIVYVASVVFYILVICYTLQELRELHRAGVFKYLKSLWNLIDLAVLIMAYMALIYNLIHYSYLNAVLKKSQAFPDEFQSIDKICSWNIFYIDMIGVCVFLVWIKIFKYLSVNKTMLQFSATLSRCAKDLFGFAVMFFIVFLAYAQLGLLIFGSRHPDFRTFGIAVITLMRMFLGDFDYQLIEQANHVLGPIYFLTYVLFVFFVLLNMFLAIINDTYGAVKQEVQQGHSYFGKFFKRLFQRIYNKYRPPDDDEQRRSESKVSTSTGDGQVRKSVSGLVREYFEDVPANEIPKPSNISRDRNSVTKYFEELPGSELSSELLPSNADSNNLSRLSNRINLLEDVLEQLINDMDRVLEKIDLKNRGKKKTKN